MLQTRGLAGDAEPEVLAQDVGNKGVLIFNRPKGLNALNLNMIQLTHDILSRWEKTKSLVISKGAGGKAYCAGGDVKSITTSKDTSYGKTLFRTEYLTNNIIATYKIPYVALIDGVVMGGGLGMSIHGRYRVATEKTLSAMPETAIGLFPDVGASYFLTRLKGKLGIYLALTGYRLKGPDNLFVGFATHYCPSAELPKLEKDLLASDNVEEVLKQYTKVPDGSKYSLEPYLEKIDDIFSAPTMEMIVERLEKDGSEWANNTLATLRKFSPLSLKVTLKELQLGSQLTLQECFKMEYRLAWRSTEGHDFKEGVRALLVDKDQNPKWNPPTLEKVSQKMVDDFFAPLESDQELKPRNGLPSSL
ncbi:3-hydroxyisobutyryl-CoA hydrolase, mitochondrial [Frankliniella fusca]|uniref:3-hydroxyisobutyryl-CoA hydrolase, mitochondrial n=1 Tax=Frankliniella fusca TaxID=407009 RepID=A0AAE1L6Q1_9NEOP|nr:3-hydroxyisobutyryl-CoA hydrolase, mitochondrial [Frankliniella fusca]